MLMAKLTGLCDLYEYEVTLEINNVELIYFAFYRPYKVYVGETYPIEISLNTADGTKLKELGHEEYAIEKIGEGFECILKGKLSDGALDLGPFSIKDNFFEDSYYFENKFVEIKVLGLWVEFLEHPVEINE